LSNVTILFIDQKNTPQVLQAFAIPRIVKFVQMRRNKDRIGIYTLGNDGSIRVVQDVTDDAELLSRAANSLIARYPNQRNPDTTGMTAHAADAHRAMSLVDTATATRRALEQIARHLARLPGRKSLIWITTSFPLRVLELGLDFTPDMEAAARALNDANVALYAVDTHGVIGVLDGMTAISDAESGGPKSPRQLAMQMHRGEPPNPPGLDTMNLLTRLTGGLVFRNDNGIEDLIRTAADDGELTYTLGFYPAQEEQDRVWHNLKVEVARRGVNLRYRENYFAGSGLAAANVRPTLEQLLKDSLDATQLGVLAEAMLDQARPGFYQTSVNVDLHDVQLEHDNARRSGGVDVSFSAEGSGKALTKTFKIDIPDDQFAAFLEKAIDTVESIDVGKAEYLRVVVQDRTTGAAGSVRVPLGKK
jgi:VWFA-related protein